MNLFVAVVIWVLLAMAALAGALVAYRSSRPRRCLWGGVLSIVAGLAAAFSGFGWAWTASLEGGSQTPGMVEFFAGILAAFAGVGLLAGRALRAARDFLTRSLMTGEPPRAARIMASIALAGFLTSQACLVLYLTGYLPGGAGAFSAVFVALTLVVAWISGALALRAAGRRGVAFLLVAPWPILAVDAITVLFSGSPGAYLVVTAAVVVVVRLSLTFAHPFGLMRRERRSPPASRQQRASEGAR